jgi:hypothetical protein
MYDAATGERLLTGQEAAEEEVRQLRARLDQIEGTNGAGQA